MLLDDNKSNVTVEWNMGRTVLLKDLKF